ncbi:MAG TPA: cytidylate kinase-like family protein [Fimbriiglobus sp.]|nr:cytidylate kinase-like family protein [Fimbriiglobus sp.]
MPTNPETPAPAPPLHGYRGAPTPPPVRLKPRGLTVAVSRESGSRGGTIAAAAGRLLGWTVYDQEMIDFLARDEAARQELLADVPATARLWAEAELAKLARARELPPGSDAVAVARLVLILAARGEAVLVGRGAGFVLPAATTVHVRVVAPVRQRVAYLSQWMRLTEPEAAAEVRARDRKRSEFLATLADGDPNAPTAYDLLLNSDRLGLEACAELIAQAVRAKQLPEPPASDDSGWDNEP